MKNGEHAKVTAEDYGAVGIKFILQASNQELGVIVNPREVDDFRRWLAETTSTQIAFMPPKAAATIAKVLRRDRLISFLGGRERAVLQQCFEALEKADLIRQEDNLAATKGRLR